MEFIGVVEVPIARLLFVEGGGERLYSEAHRKHLTDLFRDTETDHTNARHLIDGYVESSELEKTGLDSPQIKQQNAEGKFPFIEHAVVRYTQGQHRIAAAKDIDPSARWAVRLFRTDISQLASIMAVRRRTEQYQHEKPYSDGHIYTKLRIYEDQAFDYSEWHHRLTGPKKVAMLAIDQRVDVALALNALIAIPAVLDELFLTNIHKCLTLRLDEELFAGIKDLHSEWLRLSGGNMTILKHIDKKTVTSLAGRAPGASHSDLQFIDAVFESGQVFPRVKNPQERDFLKICVQQTTGLVPSLRSLQSNLKFLGIAAKIIWEFLIPKSLRRKAQLDKLSLRATLRDCWRPTAPYIEIREGEFALASGAPNFDLVYIQIILAAIRQFPYLSDAEPRVEKGERHRFPLDYQCVALFCRRAKFLGLQTSTIEENIEQFGQKPTHTETTQFRNCLDESEILIRLESRWGRPSTTIYRIIQLEGFLPTLMDGTRTSRLNAIFVLRSTLMCFLSLPSFNIDFARGVYSIAPPPKQTRSHQLQTILEEDELNMDFDVQSDNERSGSDVCMPDADLRSAERSGSDVSMRDAGLQFEGGRASEVPIRDAGFIEGLISTASLAAASVPAENQVQPQTTILDISHAHNKRDDRYPAATNHSSDRSAVQLSHNDRRFQNGHFIDVLQRQERPNFQARHTGGDQSAFVHPYSHSVPPSDSWRQTARLEDDSISCIQMGESAMTPPGSFYKVANTHGKLPSTPPSPDRQSSMAAAGQPCVDRNPLQEHSIWHRASSTRVSNDTLPTAAMLEQNVSLSPYLPCRLSEFPTAPVPQAVSITDLQSTMSQPRYSYIHSNSLCHSLPQPSLHSGTATRSSYTMPHSSYQENSGPTATQGSKRRSSNWQGFDDSDDEYESIDIA